MRLTIITIFFTILLTLSATTSYSQCSICTKTATQLGEKPAKALNSGIVYLMFTPLAIAGFIGYRWWKREKEVMQDENANA